MTTYVKSLRSDGTSPYQHARWPLPVANPDGTWTPGDWVVSAHASATPLTVADVDACAPAVYGCRPDQIARWVEARAYVIELEGAVEGAEKVGGSRGRLLRPIEGWTADVLTTWAYECADRAVRVHAPKALRAAGLTEEADRLSACPPIVDATRAAEAAEAAWAAAGAAARGAEAAEAAWAAWEDERRWQSERLAEMVGLR